MQCAATDLPFPLVAVELGGRLHDSALQRQRHREGLHDRAELVGVADGDVPLVGYWRRGGVVRVEARPGRGRQQGTVARVQHQGGAALRLVFADGRSQFLLCDLLHVGVEGQVHVQPVGGQLAEPVGCRAEDALVAVAQDDLLPRPAA